MGAALCNLCRKKRKIYPFLRLKKCFKYEYVDLHVTVEHTNIICESCMDKIDRFLTQKMLKQKDFEKQEKEKI